MVQGIVSRLVLETKQERKARNRTRFLNDRPIRLFYELQNNERNDKFSARLAFLRYTETVNFRSQSKKASFKTKTRPSAGH